MSKQEILLATPMYERHRPFIPLYMRYIKRELEFFPDLHLYWIVNNSSFEFLEGLHDYCTLNDFHAEITDLGKFDEMWDAIIAADNEAIEKSKTLNVDALYFVESDVLPEFLNGSSPLKRLLSHLRDKKVGIVSGTYHFKKMANVIGEGKVHVDAPEGNVPPEGEPDKWRRLVMARVAPTNQRAIKQLRKGLHYADVDGVPFGLTVIRREVFQKYKIPPKEEWAPFGSQDLKFCNMIAPKWRSRLVRNVIGHHLWWDEEQKAIKVY